MTNEKIIHKTFPLTNADVGRTVSIEGDNVMLDGKEAKLYGGDSIGWDTIVWGDAKHHDCSGKIKSVDGKWKGKVQLENGDWFENPRETCRHNCNATTLSKENYPAGHLRAFDIGECGPQQWDGGKNPCNQYENWYTFTDDCRAGRALDGHGILTRGGVEVECFGGNGGQKGEEKTCSVPITTSACIFLVCMCFFF